MSARPPIAAVVYDLDDTLYLERDYVRSGYGAVAGHLRSTLDRKDRFEDWLWARFESGRSAGAFQALGEEFGLPLHDAAIAELVSVYRGHAPDIHVPPEAAAVLESLGGRVKLGLLSDGYLPAQQLKLDALGVTEAFDAVVFTEALAADHAAWKPSPLGFERIADMLQTPHMECMYVGDNPSKDFVAPNRLGWHTVQLMLPGQVHAHKPAPPGGQPAKQARSWQELSQLSR